MIKMPVRVTEKGCSYEVTLSGPILGSVVHITDGVL